MVSVQVSTQTGLYKHRRWLEAENFGFKKQRNFAIRVVKTKGADQLRSYMYCEADLCLCFRIWEMLDVS